MKNIALFRCGRFCVFAYNGMGYMCFSHRIFRHGGKRFYL